MKAAHLVLVLKGGCALVVGRNTEGEVGLDEPLQLEEGAKWAGLANPGQARDLVALPAAPFKPINLHVQRQSIVFGPPRRISSVFSCQADQICQVVADIPSTFAWTVSPTFNRTAVFFKNLVVGLVPPALLVPESQTPALQSGFHGLGLKYLWFKPIHYRLHLRLSHYSANTQDWSFDVDFPLVTAPGQLAGIYGLDEICVSSGSGLFPQEPNAAESIAGYQAFFCDHISANHSSSAD